MLVYPFELLDEGSQENIYFNLPQRGCIELAPQMTEFWKGKECSDTFNFPDTFKKFFSTKGLLLAFDTDVNSYLFLRSFWYVHDIVPITLNEGRCFILNSSN